MIQNIISGVVGAVIGAVLLYFFLGIPEKLDDVNNRVHRLEGKIEVFTALKNDFEKLQGDFGDVQRELSEVATRVSSGGTSRVSGRTGVSSRWGSAWLDLGTVTEFFRGDRLRLTIGGTAEQVLVRLLPRGSSPDKPVGILPETYSVPPNRILEVLLNSNHSGITQISVHGGPNPWGMYPLGDENGSATLTDVVLVRN